MKFSLFISLFFIVSGCGEIPKNINQLTEVSQDLIFAGNSSKDNIPGSYIVSFKNPQYFIAEQTLGHSLYKQSQSFQFQLVSDIIKSHGVKDINLITTVSMTPKGKNQELELNLGYLQKNLKGIPKNNFWSNSGLITQVDFTSEEIAQKQIKEWYEDGRIWIAEPNWLNQTDAGTFTGLVENYPAGAWHWVDSMRIREGFQYIADEIAKGNLNEQDILDNAPVIAVMDSGTDYDHPAFVGRLWENESPGESDCVQDTYGCDVTYYEKGYLGRGTTVFPFGVKGANEPCPTNSLGTNQKIVGNCLHGTHVAGIVAGNVANQVPGICPICKIMTIKAVGDDPNTKNDDGGSISDSSIIRGLTYVTRFAKNNNNVIRIINASLSKFQRSRHVALLVNQLKNNSNGTLLIGAAGNEDTNFRAYPAALNDAIAVSSVENNGKKAVYSNFGIWVDVAAPGGNSGNMIASAQPGSQQTVNLNGTSQATPMVSGIAGILLAVNPDMSINTLRDRIISTANREIYDAEIGDGYNRNHFYKYIAVDNVHVPLLGSGRVDLLAALTNEQQGINITSYLNSRVQSGLCSTLSLNNSKNTKLANWLLILLLITPPLVILMHASKK